MIFYGSSTSPARSPFFTAFNVFSASFLAMLLSSCMVSPRSQHIDYVTYPSPQLQAIAPVQQTRQLPPLNTHTSEDDASCTSASHFQSDMLSRVNRLRAAGATCGGVSYPPAAPLRWSSKLQQAAAVHSQDMAMHNFFNHKSATNGTTLPERLRSVGYKYQAAGENIGAGPATVAQVIDMWLASPGHCVILMTANFVDLGASCKNNSNSYYKNYWTLKAATPS